MRHYKTYQPFCPNISTYPNIDYEKIVDRALQTYPGACEDSLTALKYLATHTIISLEKGIQHYSTYHHKEDEISYRNQWVKRYLNYLDEDCRTKSNEVE